MIIIVIITIIIITIINSIARSYGPVDSLLNKSSSSSQLSSLLSSTPLHGPMAQSTPYWTNHRHHHNYHHYYHQLHRTVLWPSRLPTEEIMNSSNIDIWGKSPPYKMGQSALPKVFHTIWFTFLSRIQRFDARPVHVGPVVDQMALRQPLLAPVALSCHQWPTTHARLFKRHQYASVVPKKENLLQI